MKSLEWPQVMEKRLINRLNTGSCMVRYFADLPKKNEVTNNPIKYPEISDLFGRISLAKKLISKIVIKIASKIYL